MPCAPSSHARKAPPRVVTRLALDGGRPAPNRVPTRLSSPRYLYGGVLSRAPIGDARRGVTATSCGTTLVSKLEQKMLPRDEIASTYLLVILAIAVTIWWRIVLRLVAALVMVIMVLGVIHLAVFLGVAK